MTSPNLPDAPAAPGTPPIAAPQCKDAASAAATLTISSEPQAEPAPVVPEVGGRRDGTDPTRFGDWEKGGRCIDF